MYADSEEEMPVAVRTRGVLGHVAGTGAYPEVTTGAEETKLRNEIRRRESVRCILTTRDDKPGQTDEQKCRKNRQRQECHGYIKVWTLF